MFELETMLKRFGPKDDPDIELPLTLGQAREIVQKFIVMRQTLRRIESLDDKERAEAREADRRRRPTADALRGRECQRSKNLQTNR